MPKKKVICDMIIQSGPNEGKKCYEIFSYCRNPKHREKRLLKVDKEKVPYDQDPVPIGKYNLYEVFEKRGIDNIKKYILDNAVGNEYGDMEMIKKIYLDNKTRSPFEFHDRSRGNISYLDTNGQMVQDRHGIQSMKIICDNIQRYYLIEINKILEANLNQQRDGDFLDYFDLSSCQNHVYNLSDNKYQRKLFNMIPDINQKKES